MNPLSHSGVMDMKKENGEMDQIMGNRYTTRRTIGNSKSLSVHSLHGYSGLFAWLKEQLSEQLSSHIL